MRKKIKQLMNKEEGFTLVELLAVIVILGIIVAIAIPSIGGIINRTQTSANTAEQDLIVDAGRLYFVSEQPTEDTVHVSTLVAQGYLEDRDAGVETDGTPSATTLTGGVERTTDGTTVTYQYKSTIAAPAAPTTVGGG